MRAREFANFTFDTEPYEGWTGEGLVVKAYDGKDEVGHVIFEPTEDDETQWYAIDVEVEEPYQRRGIATQMYNIAKKAAQAQGKIIVRSHTQSQAGKGLWQDKRVWEDTTPQVLYHATYRPLLKSIKQHGLGGDKAQAKWEDSKPGVVYLATDPNVAESYAESSDVVPDEWLDQIVVLKVNASQLDQSKLKLDRNVLDNEGDTLEYHGVIPTNLLS